MVTVCDFKLIGFGVMVLTCYNQWALGLSILIGHSYQRALGGAQDTAYVNNWLTAKVIAHKLSWHHHCLLCYILIESTQVH